MWTCRCGKSMLPQDRPRDSRGHVLKHCGCATQNHKFASLPASVAERTAMARAGNALALEWRSVRLEQKRQARARAAERSGKAYRTIEEVRASPKTGYVRQWPKLLYPKHEAHITEWKRVLDAIEYRERYKADAEFMLKERLRRQFRKKAEAVPGLQDIIGAALKSGGESATIERVLGYSITQLRQHLERQFVPGMTWKSWGRKGWHIDHVLPRKCFDLTSLEGVQAYWALSNLRPLWARKNLAKSDRVEFLC